MLFESLASFLHISPPIWGHYAGFDISLMYIVGLLLYSVCSNGLMKSPLVSLYFYRIVMAHQLCLISIAFCNVFFGSWRERMWFGFRISLIAISILLNGSSGVEGLGDVLIKVDRVGGSLNDEEPEI